MFLTRFFHAFCYAVGAEKALIQAALRVRFSRGKGFIPFPCPYHRCNAPKSSEKCPLSRNIPYWIESASGLSDCALLVARQQRRKQSSRTLARSLSLTTVFGFATCYLSNRNCKIALISCAFKRS